jgi:hypothetical protein
MFRTLSTIGKTPSTSVVLVLGSSVPSTRASSRRLRRIGAALAVLVVAAMPYAYAQSAASTNEATKIETANVTGTVTASMAASGQTAGIAKTDNNKTIGVTQPKADPSGELPLFHPLTDF